MSHYRPGPKPMSHYIGKYLALAIVTWHFERQKMGPKIIFFAKVCIFLLNAIKTILN